MTAGKVVWYFCSGKNSLLTEQIAKCCIYNLMDLTRRQNQDCWSVSFPDLATAVLANLKKLIIWRESLRLPLRSLPRHPLSARSCHCCGSHNRTAQLLLVGKYLMIFTWFAGHKFADHHQTLTIHILNITVKRGWSLNAHTLKCKSTKISRYQPPNGALCLKVVINVNCTWNVCRLPCDFYKHIIYFLWVEEFLESS